MSFSDDCNFIGAHKKGELQRPAGAVKIILAIFAIRRQVVQ